jgi:hypothetical protein
VLFESAVNSPSCEASHIDLNDAGGAFENQPLGGTHYLWFSEIQMGSEQPGAVTGFAIGRERNGC